MEEMNNSRFRDTLALTFASFFPLVMAIIYFVVLDEPEDRANPALMTAFMAGKFVQFLFPALYVAWFDRGHIRLARPTLGGLLLAAGFGVFVGAAMFMLYFGWVRHVPGVAEKTPLMIFHRLQQFERATPGGFLQMAIFICFVHSLWEEYYWRWFVFGWMRRHMTAYAAMLLSAVGFTLHHIVILGVYFPGHFWTLALPFSFCVGVGGVFWAWLYQRTGSLYATWLSHCIIDAAIMGLGYEMLSRYWI